MKNLILLFSLVSVNAFADHTVTLLPGQCVNISGNQLCWQYRPSYLDHPDQPPQACDSTKTCPITYIIPGNNQNIVTPVIAGNLYPNPSVSNTSNNSDPNIVRICKRVNRDGNDFEYSLVQINITPDGKKVENLLNEYGDDRFRCERDAMAYRTDVNYTNQGLVNGNGMVVNPVPIVDSYAAPAPCPYVRRSTINRQGNWSDVRRSIRKVFK